MIKIYVRFSIRTCKEGNNKISSFSKVTDVPQMSFLKFAKQGGQFSLCFLLRTKIKNAKRRGRKVSPSLTTTI